MGRRESLNVLRTLIFALVVVAVYANSLSGAFVIDDGVAIVHNETIREWWRFSDVLASRPDSPVAGRPLPNLTFAVNYAIGGLDVRGYHVVNVLLHLACVLLAFAVVRRTLELPSVRARIPWSATYLAFAAALVWAVHPLNTEVVNYLTQRTESLVAAFFLATLYAAIRAAGSAQAARWEALAVFSCALGMACKELMALAPILVLLYDRTYLHDSWGEAYRARKRLYFGLAASWLTLAALMATGARSASVGFSLGVSSWTYLLNQASMLARYLRLTFWPESLVAFYGWPQPLTLGEVLPQATLIVALLALTVFALLRAPKLGYLGAWFFLLLAPTSSVIPITTEVGAERRMYLPLLALVVLGVLAAHLPLRWLASRSTAGASRRDRIAVALHASLLVLICGALAWGTIARNREYASELTLARTLVERWPTGIAHQILGLELLREGSREDGLQHLQQAVALGNSRAGSFLGMTLYEEGRLNAAVERLEAFVRTASPSRRLVPRWLEPPPQELLPARTTLATVYSQRGQWAEAEEQARLVLQADPSRAGARVVLADALFARRRWYEASTEYRRYLRQHADNVDALINLGIAGLGLQDESAAHDAFERAVAADPESADAHQYLAMILLQLGDDSGAARHAREAIALGAEDPILQEIVALTSR